MAARKYVVQLKGKNPVHIEADSIYAANPGFLMLVKGGVVVAAFPRDTVDYAVDGALEEAMAAAQPEKRKG